MSQVEAPRFGIDPKDVMRTVGVTVQRDLTSQPHQLYFLGMAMYDLARSRRLAPIGWFVGDDTLLSVGCSQEGVLTVEYSSLEASDKVITVTPVSDERGGTGFKAVDITGQVPSDAQKQELARKMLAACREVLGVDLTPGRLIIPPKERGAVSDTT